MAVNKKERPKSASAAPKTPAQSSAKPSKKPTASAPAPKGKKGK